MPNHLTEKGEPLKNLRFKRFTYQYNYTAIYYMLIIRQFVYHLFHIFFNEFGIVVIYIGL